MRVNSESTFYYIYKKLYPNEFPSKKNNYAIKPYFLSSLYNNINKYKHLDQFLNGFFMNEQHKEDIFNSFNKTQNVYFGFLKLYSIFKWKYCKAFPNEYDLNMDKLSNSKSYHLITLIENNMKYTFKIHDLLNLIKNNLSNIYIPEYLTFFHEPLEIQNPYTNISFKKHNLYNIYFFLKNLPYIKFPDLFHKFYLSHFDLKIFSIHFDTELRDTAISGYLHNLSVNDYYNGIMNMFKEEKIKNNNFDLNSTFPKDKIVEAFRPFFILYVYQKLTTNNVKFYFYRKTFEVKLKQFLKINSKFGRTILRREKVVEFGNSTINNYTKMIKHYETDYIPFNKLPKLKNFTEWYKTNSESIFINTHFQQINQSLSTTHLNIELLDNSDKEDNDASDTDDDDDDGINIILDNSGNFTPMTPETSPPITPPIQMRGRTRSRSSSSSRSSSRSPSS